MKKLMFSIAGLAALAVSWALAAPIPLPTGPLEPNQLTAVINQLTGQVNQFYGYAYTKNTPLTGFSLTFTAAQQTEILLTPAGTLATGTVVLPVGILDGARACLFTTQIITALTLSAGAGQSINNAVSATTANGRVCYTYSTANTTWDRSQ